MIFRVPVLPGVPYLVKFNRFKITIQLGLISNLSFFTVWNAIKLGWMLTLFSVLKAYFQLLVNCLDLHGLVLLFWGNSSHFGG